jgi:hypothetical protein
MGADGSVAQLLEAGYMSEDELQALIASHPQILGGDDDRPLRFLLVRREAGLADAAGGGDRWSVDHLFFDHEAVPTLVEVKRSSDTRIRREVVGQMLDYAANAVVYLPPDRIRAWFEATCAADALDATEVLASAFGVEVDPEAFWERAATNLHAGRIRMLFVADHIPGELRRIVEFLNSQMDPAEVLAVEVVQYSDGGLKTLVPKTYGQTEMARTRKSSGRRPGRKWNETEALEALKAVSPELGELGQAVYDWTLRLPGGTFVEAGRVPEIKPAVAVADQKFALFALSNEGRLFVALQSWNRVPQLRDERIRSAFIDEINSLTGAALRSNKSWPAMPADLLYDPVRRDAVLARFAQLAREVRGYLGQPDA